MTLQYLRRAKLGSGGPGYQTVREFSPPTATIMSPRFGVVVADCTGC